MLSAIINCLHPPYPVLVISFMLAGFGNGLSDSAWNAWVGDLERANELLGFMHSCYGVGAVISPLIATSLVTKADLGWYTYYYVVVCTRCGSFFFFWEGGGLWKDCAMWARPET